MICVKAATSWMMYAYALEDPLSDADVTFYNNPHGGKPVYIVDRSQFNDNDLPADIKTWDLMNLEVSVPENEDTLYWCRIFKLPPLDRKHHMIRVSPAFQPSPPSLPPSSNHHMTTAINTTTSSSQITSQIQFNSIPLA